MASEEIGVAELRKLVRGHWLVILGFACFSGVVTFLALVLLHLDVYEAKAQLVVHPPKGVQQRQKDDAEVFRSLLGSDNILKITTEELVAKGLLAEGSTLVLNQDVWANIEAPATKDSKTVIALEARGMDSGAAPAMVNTWARVFIEDTRSRIQERAKEELSGLAGDLSKARRELEILEREEEAARERYQELAAGVFKNHQKRESEVATRWDQEISMAEEKAENVIASHQAQSRQLMEGILHRQWSSETEIAVSDKAKILEVVSMRVELARTPRVLTTAQPGLNPLYSELSLQVLRLENVIKSNAGPQFTEMVTVLSDLEKIQFERSAGLVALLGEHHSAVRSLRRRQASALEKLQMEKAGNMDRVQGGKTKIIADIKRRHALLRVKMNRLQEQIQSAKDNGQDEPVRLAAPAVATKAEPQQILLKVASALFLGGLLGLMIVLFRSTSHF